MFGGSSSSFAAPNTPSYGATNCPKPNEFLGAPMSNSCGITSNTRVNTSSGAFNCGQPIVNNQYRGSHLAPYSPRYDPDLKVCEGASSGKLASISAMHVYKDKSHEELRLEDYQQRFGGVWVSPSALGFTTTSATFGGSSTSLPAPSIPFSSNAVSAPEPKFGDTTFGGSGTSSKFGDTTFGGSSTSFPAPNIPFSFNVASAPEPKFGNTTSSAQVTPSFGGFRQPVVSNQCMGSQVASYYPTPDFDSKISSISAMPVFKNKSHEELRSEDYQQRNMGNPRASGLFSTPSIFGSPSPTSRTPSSTFGAPASGAPAAAMLGGSSISFTAPNTPSFGFIGASTCRAPAATFWDSSTSFTAPNTPSFGFIGASTCPAPAAMFGGSSTACTASNTPSFGFNGASTCPAPNKTVGAPMPNCCGITASIQVKSAFGVNPPASGFFTPSTSTNPAPFGTYSSIPYGHWLQAPLNTSTFQGTSVDFTARPQFGASTIPAFMNCSTPATVAFGSTGSGFAPQIFGATIPAFMNCTAPATSTFGSTGSAFAAQSFRPEVRPAAHLLNRANDSADPQSKVNEDCAPKGLEIIVEKLGFNPWAKTLCSENNALDHPSGCILLCEDAETDEDIVALAEFAAEQHSVMEKGGKVRFVRVVATCLEAVSGGRYHIVLEAKDANIASLFYGKSKRYYAAVLRLSNRRSHVTVLEKWLPGKT